MEIIKKIKINFRHKKAEIKDNKKQVEIQKILHIFFVIAYLIFTIAIGICIINRPLTNASIYIFLIVILALLGFVFGKFLRKNAKVVLITLLILAILLRIGVFFLDYSKPLESDYLFFYSNATNFANGQEVDSRYIAMFPFLAPYIVLLGWVLKIFNNSNYLMIVALNNILDIITALLIYKILKNREKTTRWLGAILWLINPINIIWTTICCPVVIVNCGITFTLYIFEKIRETINEKFNWKKFLVLNIVYGITIGFFNCFRPILAIVVIATAIYYIYKMISNSNKKTEKIILGLAILIIFLIYQLMNALTNVLISKLIKQEASTTPGWTLYLGSNFKNKGMWNEEASGEAGILVDNTELSAEEVQVILKNKAIQQYKENGLLNIKLFIQKFNILVNNISGYSIYSLADRIKIHNIILIQAINTFTEITMIIILLLNIYSFKYTFNNKKEFEKIFIYMLINMGLASSHIFVETHRRYLMPMFPALIIIATISISNIHKKDEN